MYCADLGFLNPLNCVVVQVLVVYSAFVFCTFVYHCISWFDDFVNFSITCKVCEYFALLGNALLRPSNQSVLHVCVNVYSSQSVYCRFITCCVTVTIVGQHLATGFAEWQKANIIMSCSTYAGNVNIEQLNFFFVCLWIRNTQNARYWYSLFLFFLVRLLKGSFVTQCGSETRKYR